MNKTEQGARNIVLNSSASATRKDNRPGQPTTKLTGPACASRPVAKQAGRTPVAPPVYSPQPAHKALQPKMTVPSSQGINQSKRAPVAPAAYHPQPVPRVLQTKMATVQQPQAQQPTRRPVAPPVYRPEPKKIVQPKLAPASTPPQASRTLPKAPVYRPAPAARPLPKAAGPQQNQRPVSPPAVYRPVQAALLQPKATGLPALPNRNSPPTERPTSNVVSLKAATRPAVNNGLFATAGRVAHHLNKGGITARQVIQRAEKKEKEEDYSYDTDPEDEFEFYDWQKYTDREGMPTLFTYAMTKPGLELVSNEGPHSCASVVIRHKYEKIALSGEWDKLDDELKELGDKSHIDALMKIEAPKADDKKLQRYLTGYEAVYLKAKAAVEAKKNIDEAGGLLWELENLHPYATYSWKSNIAKSGKGTPCSKKSSKTKGEKIVVTSKSKPSAKRMNCLIDKRCLNSFTDDAKSKKHLQHNLSTLFDKPEINVDNYLTNAGTLSNKDKRRLSEKKKKRKAQSDEEETQDKKIKIETKPNLDSDEEII